MMNEVELVPKIVAEQDADEKQKLFEVLVVYLNRLLENDFSRLLQILYRVDVDEAKLRRMLHNNTGHDAASIIARLLVEREEQKALSRKTHSANNAADDDEKW
jgi:hypothetical protein